MRYLALLLFLLITSTLSAIVMMPQYHLKNGKVHFNGREVQGANASTFVWDNKEPKATYAYYGRDRRNVYYCGTLVKGANPMHIHYFEVNANSNYMHDTESVFYLGKKIEGASISTFEIIYSHWQRSSYSKDANHVYRSGGIIKNCDPQTFTLLEEDYAIDRHGVYYDGELIPNSSSYNYRQYHYALVAGGKVYFQDQEYPIFDAATFGIWSSRVADRFSSGRVTYHVIFKDKNGIYFGDKQLARFDMETLEDMDTNLYCDKNGIYNFDMERLYGQEKLELDMKNMKEERFQFANAKRFTVYSDSTNAYVKEYQSTGYARKLHIIANNHPAPIHTASIDVYAIHRSRPIFCDKDYIYLKEREYVRELLTVLPFAKAKTQLKYISDSTIILADNRGVYELKEDFEKIDCDRLTFAVIPANSFTDESTNEPNKLFYIDKNYIYADEKKKITPKQYKAYMKYVLPASTYQQRRLQAIDK